MEVSLKEYEPVMVKNPETGQMVNVEPLLALLNQVGEGSMGTLGDELDMAIKYVALSDGSNVSLNKQAILSTLYEFRDAFYNADLK